MLIYTQTVCIQHIHEIFIFPLQAMYATRGFKPDTWKKKFIISFEGESGIYPVNTVSHMMIASQTFFNRH